MTFTQANKERLAKLTDRAIEAFHAQYKGNTRDFMYHYEVSENGDVYCVHHFSAKMGGYKRSLVEVDMMSRDLALLSYFLQDIIDKQLKNKK